MSSTLDYAAPAVTSYRQQAGNVVLALAFAYPALIWPLIYARGMMDDLPTGVAPDSTPLNRIFIPGLFLLALVLYLAERPVFRAGGRTVLVSFAALAGLAMLSTLWAIAPEKALVQSVQLTLTIGAVALACLLSGSMPQMVRALFVVVAATLLVNVAAVFLTPPTPIGHAGIYTHKNSLGPLGAFGVMFGIYGAIVYRGRWRAAALAMLPAAGFLLVASQSKTSLGLALLAPLLGFVFLWARRHLRIGVSALFVILTALLVGVAMLLASAGMTFVEMVELVVADSSFTGRTDVWEFAVLSIAERPVLGYGFNSFWDIGSRSPQLSQTGFVRTAPNGHNGFLDIALHLGVVGLGLFALALAGVLRQLSRLLPVSPILGYLAITFLLFACIHSLMESVWLAAIDPESILLYTFAFAPLADRGQSGPP